uniref:CCHC-type domain-containing protein n=1 Tax=Heliothis virescens TaxID=7102 RepID=A0A2A4J7C9_HELVI
MPRTTRATQAAAAAVAAADRKPEDQDSDGYSDDYCDSVVQARASTGAPSTYVRFATEAAEETRARGGAAPDDTLSGAHTGAPAAAHDTERLLTTVMESFARTQAETNRTLVETLRSLRHHGDQWDPVASTPAASPRANASATSGGNFTKCTARFDGKSRDAEVLEAFIDAVEVFKECAGVTDEHALRGLSMLLTDDAAVWWRGARAGVGTWPTALARLRATYGVQQPAYRILRQVFACEHSECERAEVFIAKVRCLLVKLPYSVPSAMQVDIVYGLLNRRIRKRLSRDSVTDIDSLLERARIVEDSISELSSSSVPAKKSPVPSVPTTAPDRGATTSATTTTGSHLTSNSKRSRVRCSFCKAFGHTSDECRNKCNKVEGLDNKSTHPIRCYGCGQPGVVRSKCTTCSNKPASAKPSDFNVVRGDYFNTTTSHPLISVGILGKEGVAIVDTGATHSVASPSLYSLLVNSGVHFRDMTRYIGLADGTCHKKLVRIATVPVTLGSRTVDTDFMIFPGDDTRTLLGRDFIANVGIILDIGQESWHFADSPGDRFPFVQSYVLNSTSVMRSDVCDVLLRPDEGTSLTPEHRAALNEFLQDRVAQFAPEGPPTDFAVHKIKMRAIIEGDNYVGDITTYLKKMSSVLLDARDVYESAQAVQKKYVDEHRRPAPDYKTQGPNDTNKGQTPKFIPRRDGPYKIQAVVSPTTYILERLRDGTVLGKYHVSVLTPFVGRIQAPVQEKRRRGRPRRS